MLRKDDKDRKDAGGEDIIAFLGKGAEFKGVITYTGTIRIDGHVEGEIITEGTLIIGDGAVINAEISAGTVVSGGKITGNITAVEKIQLLPTAIQEGSIKTPQLIIEEGVQFNGSCQMSRSGIQSKGNAEAGMRGHAEEAVTERR